MWTSAIAARRTVTRWSLLLTNTFGIWNILYKRQILLTRQSWFLSIQSWQKLVITKITKIRNITKITKIKRLQKLQKKKDYKDYKDDLQEAAGSENLVFSIPLLCLLLMLHSKWEPIRTNKNQKEPSVQHSSSLSTLVAASEKRTTFSVSAKKISNMNRGSWSN